MILSLFRHDFRLVNVQENSKNGSQRLVAKNSREPQETVVKAEDKMKV